MNRGFKFYFTQGIKKAVKTLFKRGNYLRFYIYSIMVFLLSFLGIFIPVAQLARVRLGRIIKEHEDFDLPKVFAPSDAPSTVWTTFMAILLKVTLFLGGLIIILFVGGTFFLIQLSLQVLIYGGMRNIYIFILFMLPPALLLIAYLIMYPIYLAPTMFCIDAIEKAKASETIFKSYHAVRISGKLQLALNAICYYGPMILYIVLTSALSSFLIRYGDNEMRSFALILVIIFVAIFVMGSPILVIGCRVANTLLFEDIIIDRFNFENDIKGLYIKGTKSGKVDKTNYEGSLIRLFDETETASKEKDEKPLSKEEKKMIYKQRQQESKVIRPLKNEVAEEEKEEEVIPSPIKEEEKEVVTPPFVQEEENEQVSLDDILIHEAQEEIQEPIKKEAEPLKEEVPFVKEEAPFVQEKTPEEPILTSKVEAVFKEPKEEAKPVVEEVIEENPEENEVPEEKPFIFGNPFGSSLDDDEEDEEELIVESNPFTKGKILFDEEETKLDEEEEELIAVTPKKRKSNKSNKAE